MKQQINLYLPEFRAKKDQITTFLMSQVLGGVLLTMVVITVFDVVTRWQLGNELEQQRSVLVEESRKTGQLEEQLARRSQNTELSTRLAQAEIRLSSSRQIRDFLGETKLGNVQGFSEYFKDLSRASVGGLSLTEFELFNGGESVRIAGEVSDSALVPRYVDNIRSGASSLNMQRFSPSISREDTGSQIYKFELSNASE